MGIGIIGIWGMLLVKRQIPEITEGKKSIWFHLVAEMLTAALLIVGGTTLLVAEGQWAIVLGAAALGALLYIPRSTARAITPIAVSSPS